MQKHHSRPMDYATITPNWSRDLTDRLRLRLATAGGLGLLGLTTLVASPVGGPTPAVAAEIRADEPSDGVATVASALTDCSHRLSRDQRFSIARAINEESEEYGYDPLFITALIQVESGCRTGVNGRGAIGLTQLLPSTAREVAKRAGVRWKGVATLQDPKDNVRIGVRYLSELEKMLDCPYRAVAAYNMGPRPVLRMSSARAKRVGYVRKIIKRYEKLRASHS